MSTEMEPLMIPSQLRDPRIRLVLIQIGKKSPFEVGWSTTANYAWNDQRLIEYLDHEGNYGVLCGNGLVAIDFDKQEAQDLLEPQLPETFTVKSGGKGLHHLYYWIIGDIKSHPYLDATKETILDLQSTGKQIIGPGSTHESGRKYEVVKDIPIATIEAAELLAVLSQFKTEHDSTTGESWQEWIDKQPRAEKPIPSLEDIKIKIATLAKEAGITPRITIDQEELRMEVLSLLAQRERALATERLVKAIENDHTIHTTRSAEKPELWIYFDGIYKPEGETYVREYIRDILAETFTPHIANVIIEKIATDTYVDPEEFFNTENLNEIPVENGILNIKTLTLTPFTPTKIFFNKLPIKFDPEAKCPLTEEHFKNVLESDEDIKLVKEMIGWCLYKKYAPERAFMLTGGGRNGKGVTVNLIKAMLGVQNCANIALQDLENDFVPIELFKKFANIGAEINKNELKDTKRFKSITGRDMQTLQRKFKTAVNAEIYAKMIFCCNEIPITSDSSYAFFARWVFVQFPYTFVNKDEYDKLINKEKFKLADIGIKDKLTTPEELSGLLNEALKALNELLARQDFGYSKTTEQTKRMWINKSDSFKAFFEDCLSEQWGVSVPKGDIRRLYNAWCKKNNAVPMSDKHISKVLIEEMGMSEDYSSFSGEQLHSWTGIGYKNVDVEQGSLGFMPRKVVETNV